MKGKTLFSLLMSVILLFSSVVTPQFALAEGEEEGFVEETVLYYNDFSRNIDGISVPNSVSAPANTSVGITTLTTGESVMQLSPLNKGGGYQSTAIRTPSYSRSNDRDVVLEFRLKFRNTPNMSTRLEHLGTIAGSRSLYLNAAGVRINAADAATAINVKDWHTYTIVYSASEDRRMLYVDGVLMGDSNTSDGEKASGNSGNHKTNTWYSGNYFTALWHFYAVYNDTSIDQVYFDYLKIYQPADTASATIVGGDENLTQSIQVSFNAMMGNSTVTRDKFSVSGGVDVLAVTPADDSGKLYTLTTTKMEPATEYTLTIDGVMDTMGRAVSQNLSLTTRDKMVYVEDISLQGSATLAAGEQTVNVSIVNEISATSYPVLMAVHKAADDSINSVDAIPMEAAGETTTPAIPKVTVAAEDAALELFVINDVQEPYIISDVVTYTASEKTMTTKGEKDKVIIGDAVATYTYDPATDRLTISAALPDKEVRTLNLFMLKEGKSMAAFDPAKASELFLYAGGAQTVDGVASWSFVVNTANATLPVVAYSSNGELLISENYDYVSAIYVQGRLENDVNLTDDDTVIGGFIEEVGDYLKLDMETYDALTADGAKDYLHQAILQMRDVVYSGAFADTDEFVEAFGVAIEYTELLYGANGFQILLDNKNLSDDSSYEVISKQMQKNAQDYLLEELRKEIHYSDDTIKTIVCEKAYVIAVYKAGSYTQVANTLEAAGADMTQYYKLKNPAKAANKLIGTKYDSTEDLIEAFEEAVADRKEAESESSSKNNVSSPITINPGPAVTPTPSPKPVTPVEPEKPKYPFTDLENYGWAIESISALYEKGVVSGKDEDSYDPGASVTRAEFIKMIAGALKVEGTGIENPFTDISADDWYYEYVLSAYEKGITGGVTETTFAPNDTVTREMAATLLKRAAGDIFAAGEKVFNDSDKISDWAKEAVSLLAANGVINGYETGDFNPQGALNRAEAAKLIYEILKIGGSI